MDGISSVAGITSLGCQIFAGALKISEFVSRMRDARKDARETATELVILAGVLDGVTFFEPDHFAALGACIAKVQQLDSMTDVMFTGLSTKSVFKRLRTSFQSARKSDAITRLKEHLAQTKLTLLIAMAQRNISLSQELHRTNTRDREAVLSRVDDLDTRIRSCSVSTPITTNELPDVHWEELKSELNRLLGKIGDDVLRTNLQHIVYDLIETHFKAIVQDLSLDTDLDHFDPSASPTPSANRPRRHSCFKQCFYGAVYIVTETPYSSSTIKEPRRRASTFLVRTSFIFHPSPFIVLRGLQNGIEVQLEGKASQGWKHKLRYFNAVPNNAPIFDYCKQGNVEVIQTLFQRGEASPWDVNEDGWTPLHWAARYRHRTLCQMLLECNSDTGALTYPNSYKSVYTPFDLAYAGTFWATDDESEWIDLIRCFSMVVDISSLGRSRGPDLEALIAVFGPLRAGLLSKSEGLMKVAIWILKNCVRDEIKDAEVKQQVMRLVLQNAIQSARNADLNHGKKTVRELLAAADLDLNQSTNSDGSMLIHLALSGDIFTSLLGLKILLAAGANPHVKSNEARPRNPTQIALRHADVFWMWRQALQESGNDLTDFVQQSFEQVCWEKSGWTLPALSRIFCASFDVLFGLIYQNTFPCWLCGTGWVNTRFSWWDQVSELVKAGGNEPFAKYYSFPNVSEPPDSVRLDLETVLFNDTGTIDNSPQSIIQAHVYGSIWSYPLEIRSTCLCCLTKVRTVAQNELLGSNLSDALPMLYAAIQPKFEESQLLKRRWETFKSNLDYNLPVKEALSGFSSEESYLLKRPWDTFNSNLDHSRSVKELPSVPAAT